MDTRFVCLGVYVLLCSFIASKVEGQATQESIRLVNGSHPHEGRVEVLVNGVWSAVCDFIWSLDEAKVVCKQLGYNTTRVRAYTNSYFGVGSIPSHPTEGYFQCQGTELALLSCPIKQSSICKIRDRYDAGVSCDTTIDTNDCVNHECQNGGRCVDANNDYTCQCLNGFIGDKCEIDIDECESSPCQNGGLCVNQVGQFTCKCPPGYIGTFCHFRDLPGHGSVRLVNGSHPGNGTVQILANGTWGAVCGFFWSYQDAQVVCRQLGHSTLFAQSYRVEVPSSEVMSPIWMDDVSCLGNEARLIDCPPRLDQTHSCWTASYAAVSCGPASDHTSSTSQATKDTGISSSTLSSSTEILYTSGSGEGEIFSTTRRSDAGIYSSTHGNADNSDLTDNNGEKDDSNIGAMVGGIVAAVVVVVIVVVVVVLWRRGVICKGPVYDKTQERVEETHTYTDLEVYEIIANVGEGETNSAYAVLDEEKMGETSIYSSPYLVPTLENPTPKQEVYDSLNRGNIGESNYYSPLKDHKKTSSEAVIVPKGYKHRPLPSEPVYQNAVPKNDTQSCDADG